MVVLIFRLILLAILAAVVLHLLRSLLGKKGLKAKTGTSRSGFDAHAILGVPVAASASEIKEAYHKALAGYHPDKVSHLGREIQEVAKQKTLDIIKAYEQLGGGT